MTTSHTPESRHAAGASLARGHRSLVDPGVTYDLFPIPLGESAATSTLDLSAPIEVTYDLDAAPADLWATTLPMAGLERWQALLPPLAPGLSMAEGGTPLLSLPRLAAWAGTEGSVWIKDESRNPTWSHKDRLNLCAVSAAVASGAPGVVVASSGNHGASAAAYATRAGLPCVVLASASAPPAVLSFVNAYNALVLPVPSDARWPLLRRIVEEFGFHPVSSYTTTHTGHPWGPEGYQTIAWELWKQFDGAIPEVIFLPTGYGEMLFGVAKGFRQLQRLGAIAEVPQLVASEPEVRAPLAKSWRSGVGAMQVETIHTDAYAIASPVSGYRGIVALRDSEGDVLPVTDEQMYAASAALSHDGIWVELSSAASVAGLRAAAESGWLANRSAVAVLTSSGFKDLHTGREDDPLQEIVPEWDVVAGRMRDRFGGAVG